MSDTRGSSQRALSQRASGYTQLLSQILGSLIPGYNVVVDVIRERSGLAPDKIVLLLSFFFGGWATVSYLQTTLIPKILGSFTSEVIIDPDDQAHADFLAWTAKKRVFDFARLIRLVNPSRVNPDKAFTYSYRKETFLQKAMREQEKTDAIQSQVEFKDEEIFDYAASMSKRPRDYEPCSGTSWFFHNGTIFFFSRVIFKGSTWSIDEIAQAGSLRLSCIGLSTAPLRRLIETVRAEGQQAKIYRTNVYLPVARENYYENGPWTKIASRLSRPLDTIVLSSGHKTQIVSDMNKFFHPERHEWYAERGIPYRRGYLFSGPPGTGKSSVCFSLAGIFGVELFMVSLANTKITDSELAKSMSDLPARCLVLLEDIDCAAVDRDKDDEEKDASGSPKTKNKSKVSLSGLLNAIDGVAAHEGHIVVLTSNHPDRLDSALTRPGRVDIHIRFGLATRQQIKDIFVRMFSEDEPERKSRVGRKRETLTVQSACRESTELALARTCQWMTPEELLQTGDAFASCFEPETFSPAEIQGYLLQQRGPPQLAVEQTPQWISSVLAERQRVADLAAKEMAEKEKRRKQREADRAIAMLDHLAGDKRPPSSSSSSSDSMSFSASTDSGSTEDKPDVSKALEQLPITPAPPVTVGSSTPMQSDEATTERQTEAPSSSTQDDAGKQTVSETDPSAEVKQHQKDVEQPAS